MNGEDLALQANWIAIRILRLGLFPLLVIQGSTVGALVVDPARVKVASRSLEEVVPIGGGGHIGGCWSSGGELQSWGRKRSRPTAQNTEKTRCRNCYLSSPRPPYPDPPKKHRFCFLLLPSHSLSHPSSFLHLFPFLLSLHTLLLARDRAARQDGYEPFDRVSHLHSSAAGLELTTGSQRFNLISKSDIR